MLAAYLDIRYWSRWWEFLFSFHGQQGAVYLNDDLLVCPDLRMQDTEKRKWWILKLHSVWHPPTCNLSNYCECWTVPDYFLPMEWIFQDTHFECQQTDQKMHLSAWTKKTNRPIGLASLCSHHHIYPWLVFKMTRECEYAQACISMIIILPTHKIHYLDCAHVRWSWAFDDQHLTNNPKDKTSIFEKSSVLKWVQRFGCYRATTFRDGKYSRIARVYLVHEVQIKVWI